MVALIPPGEGIKATLSNTGISRVVVGPEPFQTVTLRREPETVALSNPVDSTGTIEPDSSDGMYQPFENGAVDTMWEFRMPHAANRIDYSTLMDVLVSVDYLAFHSYDYQQTVIRQLDPQLSSDLRFSLKNDFPDAWFDLSNPDLLDEPNRFIMAIDVAASNIPPNLDNPRLTNVSIRFCGTGAAHVAFEVSALSRTDSDGNVTNASAGVARAIERHLSAKTGSGALWQPLIGANAAGRRPSPVGTWTINLRPGNAAKEQELGDALASGTLSDILFVLSYEADLPPWPD